MFAQSSAVQLPPCTSTTAGPRPRSAYSRRRPPTSTASSGSGAPVAGRVTAWSGRRSRRAGSPLGLGDVVVVDALELALRVGEGVLRRSLLGVQVGHRVVQDG